MAIPATGTVHPLYALYAPTWATLLDVFEGAGGFLARDKPYLVAHPREYLDHSVPVTTDSGQTVISYVANETPTRPSAKLTERRKLARYENIAATLVSQLAGALFRVSASRTFPEGQVSRVPRPIEQFWLDADGLGASWDDLIRSAWMPAAVFGHVFLYMDQDEDTETPVARVYTPLDAPDWLTDGRGRLTSIKFLEAAPRTSFTTRQSTQDLRVRVVTDEGWSLQDRSGRVLEAGVHRFGRLPVVPLYAKRRSLTPLVGQSVLGDPMCFVDLYNLVSEVRELLRRQTFSVLNVPVGNDGTIEREQSFIGRQSGTGNILFTSQPAAYLSPEGTNVQVYHEHIDRLARTIYRLAVVPWESDATGVEAEGSRRIKREDLNQQLAQFADECQQTDQRVTELVYRAAYGDRWQMWHQKDQLTIRWPDQFETEDLTARLAQFTDALRLDLGPTATKEAKKRASRAVLPDLAAETQTQVDAEIDAETGVTPDQRRDQEMAERLANLAKVAS